ncbi:MAG: hypothetical protein KDI63_17220 [Gammaproteobacteria bacterium]|nr:hypothetical protein [Gammaproteobacteria bacterium]
MRCWPAGDGKAPGAVVIDGAVAAAMGDPIVIDYFARWELWPSDSS